ncbi:MAG: MarR family winged helix-turn-helix transcriptional regulator [Thermomicrobiales bacterium]
MTDNTPAYRLHKLVFALDRAADTLLRAQVGISYKRALFLLILQDCGTVTQHELAVALGYSDPAVSAMLLQLAKDGYVTTTSSPEHGRKRFVTITPGGSEIVVKGRQLLDGRFDRLMVAAGVDAQHYSELTERVYRALVTKMKEEQS